MPTPNPLRDFDPSRGAAKRAEESADRIVLAAKKAVAALAAAVVGQAMFLPVTDSDRRRAAICSLAKAGEGLYAAFLFAGVDDEGEAAKAIKALRKLAKLAADADGVQQ
jgi:hypothetical protein